ncbi:hypothetical protein ACFW3D_22900 [Streptomyces sp. NPDC058864]
MQQPPGESMTRLMSLVTAPAKGGNTVDWDGLAKRYPRGFPDDYKQFMRVYGQGVFDGHLGVIPPVQEVYRKGSTIEEDTATAEFTAEELEYEEPELLVAWGYTVDADLLCWRADSPDPNNWTTVIWRRHWATPDCWAHFDCGMVELLCRYAARDLPEHWTFDLPYSGARFLHDRDHSRFIGLGVDPWGAETPPEL